MWVKLSTIPTTISWSNYVFMVYDAWYRVLHHMIDWKRPSKELQRSKKPGKLLQISLTRTIPLRFGILWRADDYSLRKEPIRKQIGYGKKNWQMFCNSENIITFALAIEMMATTVW